MTPIVGREQELARIDRFVDEAQTRYLGLVLEGHAGIGKTTVWREAVRRAEMAGFRGVRRVSLDVAAVDPVGNERHLVRRIALPLR